MRRVAVAAALTVVISVFGAQTALATSITLGAAGMYGVFVGPKESITVGGTGTTITGNLGVGQNATGSLSSPAQLNGELFTDTGVSGSMSLTPTGGVASNYSLASVVAAAQAAATAIHNATENVTMTYTSSGSVNNTNSINATGTSTSVTVKALTNLSENVLKITNLDLSNGNLTLNDNGFSGAKFIIDVTGDFNISNASNIILTGGAAAADVLFNIEGTGTTVTIAGSSASNFYGTVLAQSRNVVLQNETLHGAVIAGFQNSTTSYTYTQNNGSDLYYTAYKPAKVPEPATLALFGSGLAVLAVARRRILRRSAI